jgi:hypothetical protein
MADSASRPLPPEKVRLAYAAVAAWRADPTRPVACPACGRDGLELSDRSARPYAEWYVLSCSGCGLNHTLQIPLSPPSGGLD